MIYDFELERQLLAGLIKTPDDFSEISNFVDQSDFYSEETNLHSAIFTIIKQAIDSGEDIDEVIEWYKRERDAIDRKFNSNSKKGGNFSGSAPKSVKADGLPDKEERFEAIGVVGHNKEECEQVAREKDALPVDYKKAAEKLKKELKKDTLETKDLIKMHE